MRKRWFLLLGSLLGGVLALVAVYCGLLDLSLAKIHPAVERVLGETPQAKVIAYLKAIRRGDREVALNCWSAGEEMDADLEARRQGVTEELLIVGPALRYRVLEIEWWRTCCWPGPTDDPARAGAARIRAEITDGQDRTRVYVFDVVTVQPCSGATGGGVVCRFKNWGPLWRFLLSPVLESVRHVRRWALRDVYPAIEHPIAFPWPEAIPASSGAAGPLDHRPVLAQPDLTVEEYPIVASQLDTPGPFEYFERIPPEVLQRRKDWRDPTPGRWVAGINRVLTPFGYRLVPREKVGRSRLFYDLYCQDVLVNPNLVHAWPPTVSRSGEDFVMLVEYASGRQRLIRSRGTQPWDPAHHAFTPPVLVGDDLVAIEHNTNTQKFAVQREGEGVYTFTVPGSRVDVPIKGLWSWNGHWVLEVDGEVIVDGWSLNQRLGYDEIFGWQLLEGQPFYFFKEGGHTRLFYANHVLPYRYEQVIHSVCCGWELNVGRNETMVWFFGLREGTWYYVEVGSYEGRQF